MYSFILYIAILSPHWSVQYSPKFSYLRVATELHSSLCRKALCRCAATRLAAEQKEVRKDQSKRGEALSREREKATRIESV